MKKFVKMLHFVESGNKIIYCKNNGKRLFLVRNSLFFEKKVDFFEIYVTIVT